ncbi:pyruvate flavodoxin/ferredoxin oxidoreductase domain protein [Alkaliphilus metalliredigens QYMF]|uniref:Pyruvate flavodoxin/ferredoxin oxidoreductase domain protein n=1 Tax=Alkaliphilus metalliredigens (strain QYMF) TaxID=293826 RepID=A6TMK3_ALKMQ|nr:2-oxoacid:acceptor oxidoreductase subunit alpha [Alkaliphilus metalliredigens]ABR47421.1 pyruvate flavodoxin/ferredoxin oxidoreductase domain protein [Alkaliphilus metalliredigens QYMF]
MKYNLLIGGSAGQGMDTLSAMLEKTLKRKGYHIFTNKDYMSRVRGGHNFIQIRFGTEPITSHGDTLDFIIAFDKATIDLHSPRLRKEGKILCNENVAKAQGNIIALPLQSTAKDAGNPKVFTTVTLGAVLKVFNLSLKESKELLQQFFEDQVLEQNLLALEKGYDLLDSQVSLEAPQKDQHILISGNEAIALGALAGGVTFYSAYPMTPSTSVMSYLAKKQQEAEIVVEQVEDEIAAINMALGASYAGVRAMTGTSGGGFSLMTEALGLAAITETPLVVINVQRPGPATGLPTRTEQSDLSFILTASHGEIPRMVIAVRNPEDAFYQTVRALNIADQYQMLVILMSDQYLADYTQTIKPFDFDKLTIERHIDDGGSLGDDEVYKRYKLTENGISPRLIPGKVAGQIVLVDSDEHDEYSHITESAEVRVDMMNKRMKRMNLIKNEVLQEPDYYGVTNPETLFLAWGSIEGPMKEAIGNLEAAGHAVGALVFGDLWPLPTKELEKYASQSKRIINVEQNYTGQLARLIRQETGIQCSHSILKFDGRQLSGQEITNRVIKEVL